MNQKNYEVVCHGADKRTKNEFIPEHIHKIHPLISLKQIYICICIRVYSLDSDCK